MAKIIQFETPTSAKESTEDMQSIIAETLQHAVKRADKCCIEDNKTKEVKMTHRPSDYILTKKQARAILSKLRYEKDAEVEDLLSKLNSRERFEIMLESGAKIVGWDRHYSLMTYAADDRDGEEAFAIKATVH